MSQVSAAYDRLADVYEKRWQTYVRRSIAETMRRVDVRPGERLLDVGCGTGAFLETLGDESIARVGVDLSVGMLARARHRVERGAGLYAAEAERLPFRDASFDIAVSLTPFTSGPIPPRRSSSCDGSCGPAAGSSSPTGATTFSPAGCAIST